MGKTSFTREYGTIMKVNGSCHCGDITFNGQIEGEAIVCHCTDCQVLSGSAFRVNVKAEADSFKLTKGTLKNYTKVGDSGDPRVQAFCGNCATPIYSSVEQNPKYLFLRIGSIEQRNNIQPSVQIWQESALCNFLNMEKVPSSAKQQALGVK